MILLSSAVSSSSVVLGPVSAGAGFFDKNVALEGLLELGCESFFAPQLKAADTSGTPITPHARSRVSVPAELGDGFVLSRGINRIMSSPLLHRCLKTAPFLTSKAA